ncbi:hypothetical protein WL278_09585 [Staphylococcus caprae]|uniref:immunodominant staphylococcal antigen IsaB family protein n=1 Tax=Staphylococcus TaxID=1279 RepID=UPI0008AA2322|nr:hypothetical protein [Staphylococcus sp. HMSC62A08]OHS40356.1 hypothetical protein HMPREF3264_00875 [Staphylococcus sp. HMSC62A08]
MKKATKLLLASTITLGALMGASVTTDSPVNGSAHAATSHYYTYNGYVGRDASFLLNQQFINAVKADNVKFNGIKLAKTSGTKKVNLYDQTFKGVTKTGHSANQMQIIVKGNLSFAQIKKAYGKDLKEKSHCTQKDGGIFYYKPTKKSLEVWFVVDNNHVVEASIGHVPLTTSK